MPCLHGGRERHTHSKGATSDRRLQSYGHQQVAGTLVSRTISELRLSSEWGTALTFPVRLLKGALPNGRGRFWLRALCE